jgi:O-antigen/teichoic acid export membrane protein
MNIQRNSIYGLLGFVFPTLVVLLAYPVLIRALGPAPFGIYLLATSLGGMLAFLDFGFSAATLQYVANDMSRGDNASAAGVLVTSLAIYGAIGSAGALTIWIAAPWLVKLFAIGSVFWEPAVTAFRVAAPQFAAFFLITVCLSFFKAMGRFDLSTILLSTLSLLTYGGAAVANLIWHLGIVGITTIALVANLIVLMLAVIMTARLCSAADIPWRGARANLSTARRMWRFSAFVGLEKAVAMLANQAQRIVIAIFLGPAAVTTFVTAFTAASKATAALRAASEVMMPATASLAHTARKEDFVTLRRLYVRGLTTLAVLSVGGMGALFVSAPKLISWWLHSPISPEVATLVRILAVGFAANGITPIIYHLVAGLGRPQVNTISMTIELVFLYGVLGLLSLDGLQLRDFALAFTIDMVVQAICFMAFSELVIWRRWIPTMAREGVAVPRIVNA